MATDDCPNGAFYVCQLSGFRGCCHYDPCNTKDGCVDNSDPSYNGTSISSTIASTASISSMSSASSMSSPSETVDDSQSTVIPTDARSINTPLVIGLSIGATVAILILVSGIALLCRVIRTILRGKQNRIASVPAQEESALAEPEVRDQLPPYSRASENPVLPGTGTGNQLAAVHLNSHMSELPAIEISSSPDQTQPMLDCNRGYAARYQGNMLGPAEAASVRDEFELSSNGN
ncbi:hypothetical protein F5Y06DRAFT_298810 [Hypoxylon sp. FL0890]|nr:hypothetical protein F5Y06DRAFT_298810 [Hypoxylon sp. FL0890]